MTNEEMAAIQKHAQEAQQLSGAAAALASDVSALMAHIESVEEDVNQLHELLDAHNTVAAAMLEEVYKAVVPHASALPWEYPAQAAREILDAFQRLRNDVADALEVQRGQGPTALSMLQAEVQRLQGLLAALETKVLDEVEERVRTACGYAGEDGKRYFGHMFMGPYEDDFQRLIAAGRLIHIGFDRYVFVADEQGVTNE